MNEHCVLSLSIYCLTYIKSNIIFYWRNNIFFVSTYIFSSDRLSSFCLHPSLHCLRLVGYAAAAAAVLLHIHDSHTIIWNTLCGIEPIPFPLPTTSHPTAVLLKSYIRAHFGSVVHVCDDVECYEKPIYTYSI